MIKRVIPLICILSLLLVCFLVPASGASYSGEEIVFWQQYAEHSRYQNINGVDGYYTQIYLPKRLSWELVKHDSSGSSTVDGYMGNSTEWAEFGTNTQLTYWWRTYYYLSLDGVPFDGKPSFLAFTLSEYLLDFASAIHGLNLYVYYYDQYKNLMEYEVVYTSSSVNPGYQEIVDFTFRNIPGARYVQFYWQLDFSASRCVMTMRDFVFTLILDYDFDGEFDYGDQILEGALNGDFDAIDPGDGDWGALNEAEHNILESVASAWHTIVDSFKNAINVFNYYALAFNGVRQLFDLWTVSAYGIDWIPRLLYASLSLGLVGALFGVANSVVISRMKKGGKS